MTRQRLQKLMAAAGLCSRRRAEDWLLAGRVTVDDRPAHLGDQADPTRQLVRVDGKPLNLPEAHRVLLLNKPQGVISSCHDPRGRTTVLDLLPHDQRPGLHPVGRLDADSRGALLLTNHGELTLRLTHPRFDHVKTYRVWIQGVPNNATLKRWRLGVPLDGQPSRCTDVSLRRVLPGRSLLELKLREGRNRQIRRTAQLLGHPVLDLQRIAIAGLQLADLSEGCWRWISEREWAPLLDRDTRSLEPNSSCD